MEMISTPSKMNLISFVKMLPGGAKSKAQLVYNQNTVELDIKNLAEHQYDEVTGVDYINGCFVITVSPAPTVAEPSPYIAPCV